MIFEQRIEIEASATVVEQCFTDLDLMQGWLNPMLRCQPIADWSTEIGSKSRFIINIPLLQPTLYNTVIQREPGLIVWQFDGFFRGRDSWECSPLKQGTLLINCFEFTIPNPVVSWGFNLFAAKATSADMQAQLRRLKRMAEDIYQRD
ncbi:MAG: SRPBCC family protein [Microcystaceae cyanobacterium]